MVELPTDDEPVRVVGGDCLDVLRALPAGSVEAVVTDPPAGISFMGKTWDDPGSYGFKDGWRNGTPPTVNLGRNPSCRNCGGRRRAGPKTKACACGASDSNDAELRRRDRAAFVSFLSGVLAECYRVTRPGGRLLCWSIPRTSHWTGTAVEDAGWEIENVVAHLFGTGFPKGKSQLKPAREDWWLARKPAKRVEPLNIDAARVPASAADVTRAAVPQPAFNSPTGTIYGMRCGEGRSGETHDMSAGRWPANVVHDGSDEVLGAFAEFGERRTAGEYTRRTAAENEVYGEGCGVKGAGRFMPDYGDSGTAARFFYTAKASKSERMAADDGTRHPTQKPVALMRWLVRLVTRPGDLVLDPFAGSGTTGLACAAEGRRCLLVEREPAYCEIARRRMDAALADRGLFA